MLVSVSTSMWEIQPHKAIKFSTIGPIVLQYCQIFYNYYQYYMRAFGIYKVGKNSITG